MKERKADAILNIKIYFLFWYKRLSQLCGIINEGIPIKRENNLLPRDTTL